MDGENCLSPDTIINTEDGNKSIKEICESKYLGKSLSMDIDTNEIEFQNIVNHSIIDHDVKDDWFEIELENGVKIEITGNHYVFLPKLNCYRKVSELKTDDDVIFLQ
jgi:intein/homing endonuclease